MQGFFLLNMFYVYILYSDKCNRFYVGYSEDVEKRLEFRHNKGKVKSTKNCMPYVLMKKKSFETKLEAIQEERRIKKLKSSKYIQRLIDGDW